MTIFGGLWAAVILVALAWAWTLPYVQQRTIVFGVRIPPERAADPRLRACRGYYLRAMGVLTLFALSTGTLLGLCRQGAWTFLILFLALYGLWLGVRVQVYHRLRRMKQEQGWYTDLHQAIMAEVGGPGGPDVFPGAWLAPAGAILFVTLAIGLRHYPLLPARVPTNIEQSGRLDTLMPKSLTTAIFGGTFAGQIAILVAVLLCGWIGFRLRQELDVTAPLASARQQRRARLLRARAWLLYGACLELAAGLLDLSLWGLWPLPRAWVVPMFCGLDLVGAIVFTCFSLWLGPNGSRLRVAFSARERVYVNRDDDAYWKGGLLYLNADDSRLWVTDRLGFGPALNFARPWAWPMAGVALLVLVVPSIVLSVQG